MKGRCDRRALTPPGYKKEYHIGIRVTKTGALMGFITAVPQMVHVRDKLVNMVDVGSHFHFECR